MNLGGVLASDKQSELARVRRRLYPIHFYTGRNGGAKSMCAVYDTMPSLDQGYAVLSTVRLLDWRDARPCEGWEMSYAGDNVLEPGPAGLLVAKPVLRQVQCRDLWHGRPGHMQAHPLWAPLRDWEQLLAWEFGDVIMDEITGVADSNEQSALPAAVGNKLAQLRRDDVPVRITGLNWIRANKRLREAVSAVTRCQTTMPVPDSGTGFAAGRRFRPRRLAHWTTYDAQSLPVDDHTDHAYEQADVICKGRHWIPTSDARFAYDTFAPVLRVGVVTDAGRCAYCGGNRRPAECSCADYVQAKSERQGRGRKALAPTPAASAPDPDHGHGQGCSCGQRVSA